MSFLIGLNTEYTLLFSTLLSIINICFIYGYDIITLSTALGKQGKIFKAGREKFVFIFLKLYYIIWLAADIHKTWLN